MKKCVCECVCCVWLSEYCLLLLLFSSSTPPSTPPPADQQCPLDSGRVGAAVWWTKNSIPSHIELVLVWAGVRQVKPLLPPFLARNSALVEQQQQAAAAHSVPLPALHLHTCVASCQAGSSFQSVGIILAGQQSSQR